MPSFRPIQLIPPGLLGLFQLKQEGRGIVELPDVLQGTLELRDWYFQARVESNVDVHGVVIGTNTFDYFREFAPNAIVVPAREYWYVHNFTVFCTAGNAADRSDFWPAYIPQQQGSQFPVALAATQRMEGTSWANPSQNFFLPPGAELGFGFSQSVDGASPGITYDGNFRITRLPI